MQLKQTYFCNHCCKTRLSTNIFETSEKAGRKLPPGYATATASVDDDAPSAVVVGEVKDGGAEWPRSIQWSSQHAVNGSLARRQITMPLLMMVGSFTSRVPVPPASLDVTDTHCSLHSSQYLLIHDKSTDLKFNFITFFNKINHL